MSNHPGTNFPLDTIWPDHSISEERPLEPDEDLFVRGLFGKGLNNVPTLIKLLGVALLGCGLFLARVISETKTPHVSVLLVAILMGCTGLILVIPVFVPSKKRGDLLLKVSGRCYPERNEIHLPRAREIVFPRECREWMRSGDHHHLVIRQSLHDDANPDLVMVVGPHVCETRAVKAEGFYPQVLLLWPFLAMVHLTWISLLALWKDGPLRIIRGWEQPVRFPGVFSVVDGAEEGWRAVSTAFHVLVTGNRIGEGAEWLSRSDFHGAARMGYAALFGATMLWILIVMWAKFRCRNPARWIAATELDA